jgi:CRISPR-associated protein Cmr6
MKTSNAPLPDGTPANRWPDVDRGNLGLWYDKHCDRWKSDFRGLYDPEPTAEYGGGKLEWLGWAIKAAHARSDDPHFCDLVAEFATRQRRFALERGGVCFRGRTVTKFVSGLGRAHPVQNGFEWHHSLGVPMLRGSGQKGVVRDWVTIWETVDPEHCKRVLGTLPPELREGSVAYLPALPTHPPELCIDGTTPHLTEYYQHQKPPADWYNPVPQQWLAVAKGVEFQFAVVPVRRAAAGQRDVGMACDWLKAALTTIGAGAGTAVDRGLFEIVEEPRAGSPS